MKFAFDDTGNQAAPPSNTKTAFAVWVGLYPTVVLLSLALRPLKMPLWEGPILATLLSSFIISWCMPAIHSGERCWVAAPMPPNIMIMYFMA